MLITNHCKITRQQITRNGRMIFQDTENLTASEYLKSGFKSLCVAYPKFYKMDILARLGFLSAEVLLGGRQLSKEYSPGEIALVMQNASSTVHADTDHCNSIRNPEAYFPSPAVFVYTLPNIMLGEICIRNGFFGENLLFSEPRFNPAALEKHVHLLSQTGRMQCCIAGWAEARDEFPESFMVLIEPRTTLGGNEDFITFTAENLENLYNSNTIS